MNILFLPLGTAGDVLPHLALARTLAARGHAVRVATHHVFADAAARFGVPHEPIDRPGEHEALLADPDLWHPRRSTAVILNRGVSHVARAQCELALAQAERGGLTVGGTLALGALCAAEARGIAYATVHLQPMAIWSTLAPPALPEMHTPAWLPRCLVAAQLRLGEMIYADPPANQALGELRRSLGLPPVRRLLRWWHAPECVIALFPPWYAPAAGDWPRQIAHAGFPLWDEPEKLPAELEDFLDAGDPPVVATPGSGQQHAAGDLAATAEACRRLGRRALLLTRFPAQLPSALPAGVRTCSWAPLGRLLPRCAALVHHGGIGTSARALAAGIPQVVLPRNYDQPDNAARLRQLGVAEDLPPRLLDGGRLAAALGRLLGDGAVSARCSDLRSRLAAADGLALAADRIEAYGVQRGLPTAA